jgi:hypothetical protein
MWNRAVNTFYQYTSITSALVKRTNSVIPVLSTDRWNEGTSIHISVTNSIIFTDILSQLAEDLQNSATDLITGTAKPAVCCPSGTQQKCRQIITITYMSYGGTEVAQWLWYKSEGRWFYPRWCHRIFHWHKSFRSHYGPGVDSASNRNEYQEYFLGGKCGRCVRLTLPPSCAFVKKSENLNFLEPSGPPQACNGTASPYITYQQRRVSAKAAMVTIRLDTIFQRNHKNVILWYNIWQS